MNLVQYLFIAWFQDGEYRQLEKLVFAEVMRLPVDIHPQTVNYFYGNQRNNIFLFVETAIFYNTFKYYSKVLFAVGHSKCIVSKLKSK